MGVMCMNEDVSTSGVSGDDVLIYHCQEYVGAYQYESGRSFLEICIEMGLDSTDTHISF